MKTAFGVSKYPLMARLGIFLVVLALVGGMVGCVECGGAFIPEDLEIRDWHDLRAVRNNLGGNHRLMNDLDANTAGYQAVAGPTANEGRGWASIGFLHMAGGFHGTFDGQGYEIRDLFVIDAPGGYEGLFGHVGEEGVIKNVGVVNAEIAGATSLLGMYVGGLVGLNRGTVSNSYFTGSVTGYSSVGGLVGSNDGTVSNSYSAGSVIGTGSAGGLVGSNKGTVRNCYSTGTVTRSYGILAAHGGFVGSNEGKIVNCYSAGSVQYEGRDDPTDRGFAGTVTTGGDYEMTGNFWDIDTSGQASTSGESTGKTTAEMKTIATFEAAGWSIMAVAPGETNRSHTWNIIDGQAYPFLSWQPVS